MEEPDLEELEWMASKQYPSEDDADAYFNDNLKFQKNV